MRLTLLKGYPDFVGKRATFVGYGSGPAVYNATTGDPVQFPLPNWYIDAIGDGCNSVSGNFFVRAQPSGVGARQTWSLFWYASGNATPVANGSVALAVEQVQVGGNCGQY
jgi:hypothetical protein